MFEVHSNSIKNRLYISVSGKLELNEMQLFVSTALQEVSRLRPGFGIITDITTCEVITEESRQELERFMKALKEQKKGMVVRIVNPLAAMVSMQWQRSSWKSGYTSENVTTLRDAEKKMDENEQKVSLPVSVVTA